MDSKTDPDFEYLANSPVLAEVATLVKRLTGLAIALNAPGVTDIRMPRGAGASSALCELVAATEEGFARCRACDRRHHARAAATGRALLYTCHAGFLDVAVPLLVDGRHVATISSGQVLAEPPSEAGATRLRRRLSWLPVSDRVFHAAYRKAPYLPRSHVRDVMRLLEVFAGELYKSARRIRDLEARLERAEIRRAREFVERHFREPRLRLCDVAAAAGLSPAHFSHVFRHETGQTFTRFVQARRVTEAKRLLESTKQSVTNICFACGFSNLTHFNRIFRRFEHCSPSQAPSRARGSEVAASCLRPATQIASPRPGIGP